MRCILWSPTHPPMWSRDISPYTSVLVCAVLATEAMFPAYCDALKWSARISNAMQRYGLASQYRFSVVALLESLLVGLQDAAFSTPATILLLVDPLRSESSAHPYT